MQTSTKLRALSAVPSVSADSREKWGRHNIHATDQLRLYQNIKSNENPTVHHEAGLSLLLGLICRILAYLAASSFRAVITADTLVLPAMLDGTNLTTLKAARGATIERKNAPSKRVHDDHPRCLHSLTIKQWRTQVKVVKGKRARTGGSSDERLPSPERLSPIPAFLTTDEAAGRSWRQGVHPQSDESVPSEQQRALLRQLYFTTWETVFGNWMSRYGCPFVFGDENVSEHSVSISALCSQLDSWMRTETSSSSPGPYTALTSVSSNENVESQTRQSLDRVICSYAARWLVLFPPTTVNGLNAHAVARKLWREARADMLRVMNRPSYRSMLTLYLFGLTPIPEGISDEEELDGVTAQVCVQIALQQVYSLRVRQKSVQFSGSKFSPTVVTRTFASSPDRSFIIAENILHWATLTFDTSASLTLSSRPMLSSGILSYTDLCWSLVRSCAELFHSMTQEWHAIGLPMSDAQATQLVASGNSFKLLLWKLSAVFRESIRDGHDEAVVNNIHGTILDTINQYNRIYRTPLDACRKRISSFSQETKLRYYDLVLHTSLPILLIIDAVDTEHPELLKPLITARTDAEHHGFSALVFAQEMTYDPCQGPYASSTSQSPEWSSGGVRVPLLSIDPYPHHVVASVHLMRRAIDRDIATKKLDAEAHARLLAVLNRTLDLLPDSSKSVRAAKKQALSQTVGE